MTTHLFSKDHSSSRLRARCLICFSSRAVHLQKVVNIRPFSFWPSQGWMHSYLTVKLKIEPRTFKSLFCSLGCASSPRTWLNNVLFGKSRNHNMHMRNWMQKKHRPHSQERCYHSIKEVWINFSTAACWLDALKSVFWIVTFIMRSILNKEFLLSAKNVFSWQSMERKFRTLERFSWNRTCTWRWPGTWNLGATIQGRKCPGEETELW